jgi:hypothetical protein
MLQLGQDSPLAPRVFDLSGVAFAGWTLAAQPLSARADRHRPDQSDRGTGPGYLKYFTCQPARRFLCFQLIEGGWPLAQLLLLGAATVWLIRHRAT